MSSKRLAAVLTAFALGVFVGCEKNYNRADISSDGRRIAFSLNRNGGFATDDTSEIYIVDLADDLSKVTFKRLTRNRVCDAWADFSPDGQSVLFVRGDTEGGMSVWGTGDIGEEMNLSDIRSNFHHFPQFLDDDTVFFASLLRSTVAQGSEIVCNILRPVEADEDSKLTTMDLHEVVRIPWNERDRLWSTLPAFQASTMYYAVAHQLDVTEDLASAAERTSLLNITLWAVDMSAAQPKPICHWTFSGDLEDPAAVGMADLTVSPDGKRLLCCFLPGEEFTLTKFDDQKPSTVYTVDLESDTREPELLARAYMYYPQFAPMREGVDEDYAIVFLSGAGFGEKGGRSVCTGDVDGDSVITLASFPGEVMTAYTDWTWLSDKRLRIFHVCDDGLILVDTNRDGSDQVKRYLPKEGMLALKRAADLDRGYGEFTREFDYTLEEFSGEDETPSIGGELFHYLKSERDDADAKAHDVRLTTGDHPAVETPTSQPFDVLAPGSIDDIDGQE